MKKLIGVTLHFLFWLVAFNTGFGITYAARIIFHDSGYTTVPSAIIGLTLATLVVSNLEKVLQKTNP